MLSRVRLAALMIMLEEPQLAQNWSSRCLQLSKVAALIGTDTIGNTRGASSALGKR